jgi:hypothetical protein
VYLIRIYLTYFAKLQNRTIIYDVVCDGECSKKQIKYFEKDFEISIGHIFVIELNIVSDVVFNVR